MIYSLVYYSYIISFFTTGATELDSSFIIQHECSNAKQKKNDFLVSIFFDIISVSFSNA